MTPPGLPLPRPLRWLLSQLNRITTKAASCNHCDGPLPCREHDGPTLATVDKPWPREPS